MKHEWKVLPKFASLRLDAYLQAQLPELSKKKLQRALEHNLCQVNGQIERFASYRVRTQDHILFMEEVLPKAPNQWEPARVLYEDDDFLAYNKPAGISSDQEGLANLSKKKLLLVHRLDKGTSGLLLFAKSQAILEAFKELFRKFKVEKTYLAIVDGHPKASNGNIENYLGKVGAFSGQTLWGSVPPTSGLYAATSWEVVSRGKKASLLVCTPKTGRTHQIRTHLASLGHPILGDRQYGKRFSCETVTPQPLLHALHLSFPHPKTKKPLKLLAPLPQEFERLITTLALTYSERRWKEVIKS